jgi:hypothetical protein
VHQIDRPILTIEIAVDDILVPTPQVIVERETALEYEWRIFRAAAKLVLVLVQTTFGVRLNFSLHLQAGAFRKAANQNPFDLHPKIEGSKGIGANSQSSFAKKDRCAG